MKKTLLIIALMALGGAAFYAYSSRETLKAQLQNPQKMQKVIEDAIPDTLIKHPLMISELRKETFPGSELVLEETLAPGSNYNRYIVSYQSEGNKIYALLTIPQGEKPYAAEWRA